MEILMIGEIADEIKDEIDSEDNEPEREAQITIVIVAPDTAPQIVTIDNELAALQGVVEGLIEVFPVGIADAVGICNEEGLIIGLPPCRFVRAAGTIICGTFFIAGDGINFRSLSQPQIDTALHLF